MAAIFQRDGKPKWYAMLRSVGGKRMRVALLNEQRSSELLASSFERAVSLRSAGEPLSPELTRWADSLCPRLSKFAVRLGILTQGQLERSKSLHTLIEEWRISLDSDGSSKPHAVLQANRVASIVKGCRWTITADMRPEPLRLWLASQRRGEGREKPLSVSSSNHYLTALRTFCRWLVIRGILPADPTVSLQKLNDKAARTIKRRALTEQEIALLFEAAETGPDWEGITGYERSLLYRVAIETGLRANELRSLTKSSLLLSRAQPLVVVSASNTKNGKEARIPLLPETAELLSTWLASKSEKNCVFSVPHRTALMLAFDLERANVAKVDEAGGTVDFHSLRYTFITRLARAGVPMAAAQKLARHSTPVLTFNVYTCLGEDDGYSAIRSLPALPSSRSREAAHSGAPEALSQATRSDGPSFDAVFSAPGQQVVDQSLNQLGDQTTQEWGAEGGQLGQQTGQQEGAFGVTLGHFRAHEALREERLAAQQTRHFGGTDDVNTAVGRGHLRVPRPPMRQLCGKEEMSVVARAGIEPATHGFSIRCSTS